MTLLSDARKKYLVTTLQKEFLKETLSELRTILAKVQGDGTELLTEIQINEILALARPEATKKRLRHITRQNKKTKTPISGKYETRHLKDYPGYWIDEMSTVFGPNGQPVKYRYHKSANFVRLKSASGKWTDKAVYWLMVGVGFEEHPSAKKARRTEAKTRKELLKCYNDEAEAIAEDPEMFGQVE